MKRKHLLHFLLVALLIVTFVAVFAISASAETPAETDVFEVLNASGEHVAYAETLDAAKTSMAAGYTLKVLKNATVDLTLDMDYAYNLDATGVTVTGAVAQSKGTVTVKGGTFTTSGTAALWTMTGSNTNLTVEDAAFTNTNAGDTTAASTVGAIFVFNQTAGNVEVKKGTLTANGTLFYWKILKVDDKETLTKVNLTVGADVNGTSKKFVIYVQWSCGGDITFNGGNWEAGRVAHVCGGRESMSGATGTLTYNGGNYHSLYISDASAKTADYKAKCLVQNDNDFGGLYVNNYSLTVTGGTFTFDGAGVAFLNAIGALNITGGTFKTTQKDTSVTSRQAMLFMQNATNKGNSITNATFEAYGHLGHNGTTRGVVWGDVGVYIVFGEGTKVIAHGSATAVHFCGAPDKTVIFTGGTYTSETGYAFHESGANPLSNATTGGIYFNGGTFRSATTGDNGVIDLANGAYHEINGATFIQSNSDNVIFRVRGVSSAVFKKGTFTGGTFIRIRGEESDTAKGAVVIMDPEKDEDLKFEFSLTTTSNPMFWIEGDARAYPTVIIKGGIYTRNSSSGYIFRANNPCRGNLYILGGQFTANGDSSIFGIQTHNSFNVYVLGGNFVAGWDFICHSPGGSSKGQESQVKINIYGKGENVNLNLPTLSAYGDRAVKTAGLSAGTAVSAGVYVEGRILLANTNGYTSSQNVLNIYGGTFIIRNGGKYNILNLGDEAVATINIYGGTFRNLGGTSRFIKSEGARTTLNFYGGTFTSEDPACQDFMAFNGSDNVCYDVVTFYGAGTYNGIATEGVTIIHQGRKGSNSALLLTCDGAKNEIQVTVKGGTFRYTSAAGCSNMFFSWNNKYDLAIEGGTFIGDTTFSRNYGNSNIVVKNATISMLSGPKSLFLDHQDVTGESSLDLENTISGTFTFYRGTKYEITGEWATFSATGGADNTGKFEIADANGDLSGMPCDSMEEAFLFIEDGSTLVLLGDVVLNSTLKVTQNLTIDAKGYAIHATCNPFELAEGVTLTIVNAFIEDDDMFVFNGGNVVLRDSTLKLFGTKQMMTIGGNTNITFENCKLQSPAFTTKSGAADLYNGTFLYLDETFTGKVIFNGGSVTEGMKLVYAAGFLDPAKGAKGEVSFTGMTFANRQYVVYSRQFANTSFTLNNCTSSGAPERILHICGAASTEKNTGFDIVVKGGTYETTNNFIYSGGNRYPTLTLNDVTATGNGTDYMIDVRDTTLNLTGGTYTQNGDSGVLFFWGKGTAGKDVRFKGVVKDTTMISHATTNHYNRSTIWASCVTEMTISNSVVKALNALDGNYVVTVARALSLDGGAEVTIESGEFVSYGGDAVGNATGNGANKLTINGGTFSSRYPGKDAKGAVVGRVLVWSAGGTVIINDGTFHMEKPVEGENANTGYCVGGSAGTVTINGGSFVQLNDADAVISADTDTTININGGYFASMGMCVARVLGGTTGSETNGVVTKASKATLNITGGVLVLLTGGRSGNYVAVVRAGGGSTYGTVNISGGTYINQRGDEENATVIFKNNAASSMSVTGGTFLLAAPTKEGFKGASYIYRSNGYVDSTGAVENKPTCNITIFGEAFSKTDNAAVNDVAHATAYYGSGMYYVIGKIAGDGDYLLDGAQARLRTEDEDLSGIRFISTFPAELVKKLEAKAEEIGADVEYYTIITATKNVLQTGAPFTFTQKALDDKGVKYKLIRAENGLTVNADDSVTIRAALIKIQPQNYDLSFTAISFAKVGDEYYYSNYDFAANSRSIAEVAEKALADKTGSLPCYDETGAATGESTSKYTKEEQKVLYKYLGKTWAAVIE